MVDEKKRERAQLETDIGRVKVRGEKYISKIVSRMRSKKKGERVRVK